MLSGVFSQVQPGEVFAILATLADFLTTAYGVMQARDRVREGNPLFTIRTARSAALWIVAGIALHLLLRARADNYFTDAQQWKSWITIAVLRGAVAAWNIRVLATLRTKK